MTGQDRKWYMGSNHAGNYDYIGKVDELHTYDRAITATEAAELYNSGAPGADQAPPYPSGYDTAKDTYNSTNIALSGSISNFTSLYRYIPNGYNVTVNVACDGYGGTYTALVNNTVQDCPVNGSTLHYTINLSGTSAASPTMLNLTLEPGFIPASPAKTAQLRVRDDDNNTLFTINHSGNAYILGNLNITGCIHYNGGTLGVCV